MKAVTTRIPRARTCSLVSHLRAVHKVHAQATSASMLLLRGWLVWAYLVSCFNAAQSEQPLPATERVTPLPYLPCWRRPRGKAPLQRCPDLDCADVLICLVTMPSFKCGEGVESWPPPVCPSIAPRRSWRQASERHRRNPDTPRPRKSSAQSLQQQYSCTKALRVHMVLRIAVRRGRSAVSSSPARASSTSTIAASSNMRLTTSKRVSQLREAHLQVLRRYVQPSTSGTALLRASSEASSAPRNRTLLDRGFASSSLRASYEAPLGTLPLLSPQPSETFPWHELSSDSALSSAQTSSELRAALSQSAQLQRRDSPKASFSRQGRAKMSSSDGEGAEGSSAGGDGSGEQGGPPPPPSSGGEGNGSSGGTSVSKRSVPEVYPEVMALPIVRRPLFPGFCESLATSPVADC